ncbi:MAG: type II secretion system protein M, partial [Porticoccaceae bacterium]|nr:type II secretion system protein M [Porticoccaceae bacterium]
MNELSTKFDALQQREKILLAGVIVALVYMSVEFLLLKPADDQHAKLTSQLETNRNALASSQEQLAQLQANGAGSDTSKAPQLRALQQQISALREELDTLA